MAKSMKTAQINLAEVKKTASLAYVGIVLIVVCFFLYVVRPQMFVDPVGLLILGLIVWLCWSCGKMYALFAAFIIGTFILYAHTNTQVTNAVTRSRYVAEM